MEHSSNLSLYLSIGIFVGICSIVGIGIIGVNQLNHVNQRVEALSISTLKAGIASQLQGFFQVLCNNY